MTAIIALANASHMARPWSERKALPSIMNATGPSAKVREEEHTVYTAFRGGGEKSNKATLCHVSSHLQPLKSHLPFWGTFATFNKSTEIHHLAEIREVLNFKSGHYLLKLGSPCW